MMQNAVSHESVDTKGGPKSSRRRPRSHSPDCDDKRAEREDKKRHVISSGGFRMSEDDEEKLAPYQFETSEDATVAVAITAAAAEV